jgi:hypothetical protein
MSNLLAIQSLKRSQRDFEEADRSHSDLHCVIFWASRCGHERGREPPYVPILEGKKLFKTIPTIPVPEDEEQLVFYYFGDQNEEVFDRFGQLALEASRAWMGLVPKTVKLYPVLGHDFG